jgi:ribonuclease HI
MEFPVSHYVMDGKWNWEVLNQLLPREICEKILAIKPPSNGKSDFPCWNLTSDGNFSLKSAYFIMHDKHHSFPTKQDSFQHIWSWQGPNRYKAFLWKIAHDKILTNEERHHRGMTRENLCPRCGDYPETIMHVLRDCEELKMFWNDLICQDDWSKFFSLGLHRWIDWNITTSHIGSKHDNWQIFFGVAVCELWKDRNSLVFNRKSLIENQLLRLVTNQANFITSSSNLHVESNLYPSKRSIEVSWTPPPHDHYKVNVDGSHKKSSGISTCGGLIRDSNGKCIRGFYNRLGSCSAVWAELWALHIGIEMANQLNIKNVIFEMDSLVVVNMVNLGSSPNAFLQPLLQEVTTLLHHPGWSTSVCHVYREANRCADLLANLGHTSLDFNCNFIDVFSPTLKLLLEDDVRGVSFPRLIQ